MTGKGAAIVAFVLALSAALPASAEHQVYYRYTVLGYVRDVAGKAQPGVEVELVREKTGFSYLGQTDTEGLYVIVARLGDESVGEQLRLRAGRQSIVLIARFDQSNHVRERGTRVDFRDGETMETPAAFASTLRQFLDQ